MRSSENITDLAGALAQAQGAMPAAPLDGTNSHFSSRYATLTALVSTARPVLAAHGLAVIQGRGTDGGLETTILHASGQWITLDGMPMKPTKDDPQGMASAITYARRYGLAAAVGLVADDDDDGNAASKPHADAKPEPKPTPSEDAPAHKEPGARVDRGAAIVEGRIVSTPRTDVVRVKGEAVSVARFDLETDDGNKYSVTAWHGARDEAMNCEAGEQIEITGTWNHYRDQWNINAAAVQSRLPF